MDKITKEIPLMDLIKKHPQAAQELAKMGLGCIGCAVAQFETLEQGLRAHGMDVDGAVKRLNEALGNKE